MADPTNLDLMYPHCQMTSQAGYVKFEQEVPVDYLVGEAVERLLNSLEQLDGDDQRIVFFFDN